MKIIFKKFLFFYFSILAVSVIVCALIFNIYANYILNVIQEVSRNPVMIHDSFSLKKSLSPLIVGNIHQIELLNSQNQNIYLHSQNTNPILLVTKEFKVFDRDNLLYSINIKIDVLTFVLILLALAIALLFLYIPFAKYEQKELANKSNELLAGLSKKLAHDIRTPLSTLNLISSKIPDLEIRSLQHAVVKQIDLIAEDLLKTGKNLVNQENASQSPKNSFQDFFELIEGEFKIKSDNLSRKIAFDISSKTKKLETVHAKQLYPIICNCLNNAIEAIDKVDVQIKLCATIDSNQLSVIISDNGRGIPKEILSKLGHQPITSGKNNSAKSGNGIALYNAKKDITDLGGSFGIESDQGRSTHVHIRIPLS